MEAQAHYWLFAIAIGLGGSAHAAGNAVRGQQLYQARCASCHSIEYNGVGPAHQGVFGRKAGSAPGYTYSPALQASTLVWNETTLGRWLANPEKLVPGQKMGISVPSAAERADLIAYLKRDANSSTRSTP
jgi:cytochrome c